LTARDASSDIGNILTALNLANPHAAVPALPNPSKPLTRPCVILPATPASVPSTTPMGRLAESDLMQAWKR
jgi:hypothetical protein